MRSSISLILLACLLAPLQVHAGDSHTGSVRSTGAFLGEGVFEFILTDATLLDGLKKLSSEETRFQFGFEAVLKGRFSDPPLPDVRFSLTLHNKTVRELLDALCSADSRYTWAVEDSIINVYPRASIGGPGYLLNRKLPRLEIRNINEVEQGLLAIAQQLPPPSAQIAHAQIGGDASYPTEPWTASFDHLTVRQAINRLTTHMGPRACWIFYGSLDFRAFAFFRWGFAPR